MKHSKRTKLFIQKLIGIALILMGIIVIIIASNAKEARGADGGAAILLIPCGIALLLTKNVYLDID